MRNKNKGFGDEGFGDVVLILLVAILGLIVSSVYMTARESNRQKHIERMAKIAKGEKPDEAYNEPDNIIFFSKKYDKETIIRALIKANEAPKGNYFIYVNEKCSYIEEFFGKPDKFGVWKIVLDSGCKLYVGASPNHTIGVRLRLLERIE